MIGARGDTTNAGTFYEETAQLFPDKPAVVSEADAETMSFGELSVAVDRMGGALGELTIGQGDRVALFFGNEVSLITCFFGAMRRGAVPVLVNIEAGRETIEHVVEDCDANLIVSTADEEILERAVEAATDVESITTLAVAADDPESALSNVPNTVHDTTVVSLPQVMAEAPPDRAPVSVEPHETALQAYTSGSTGKPKGCTITHGGIWWNIESIVKVSFADEKDTALLPTPLYHMGGWLMAVLPMLLTGGTFVMMKDFDANRMISLASQHDVTCLTGVTTIFKMVIEELEADDALDLTNVNWGMVGGEPVPEALQHRCQEEFDGFDILNMYGLTEGGPTATLSPRFGVQRLGSAGLALPGCTTRIEDPETGKELPSGTVGEILLSNPAIDHAGTIYYDLPNEEEAATVRYDGKKYLKTNDLGRKDEDGFHFISGRLDDMMIVGGENVYPAEVEDRLLSHDAVTDAAVVPASHAIKNEVPVAFVVAEEGVTEEELISYTIDNGPAYAHPRRVFILSSLPITSTRKIDYGQLVAELEDRIDTPLGEE